MTVKIDFIPGMPPDFSSQGGAGDEACSKTNQVLHDSMPIVYVEPGLPAFSLGVDYFSRSNAFKNYSELLQNHGFELSPTVHNGRLTLAYLADSFPTDTFANEYGENFFQSLTNVASEGAASLAQVLGQKSASGVVQKGIDALNAGALGTVGQYAGAGLAKAKQTASEIFSSLAGKKGMSMVDALMAGGRIDFPLLWKNSSYTPSYTMTIRLYNPNPASKEATEKYIVGPIAAIMLLGVPMSPDNTTYSWPFVHSFDSPGIYHLDPAFISNITVVKGGDQQQIALNQNLALVDVRIDVGSLFNSMLIAGPNNRRPTVHKYLETLRQSKTVRPISNVGEIIADQQGNNNPPENNYQTNSSNTVDQGGEKSVTDRVTDTIKDLANTIINQIPSGLKF
jgi:hypothetical protein